MAVGWLWATGPRRVSLALVGLVLGPQLVFLVPAFRAVPSVEFTDLYEARGVLVRSLGFAGVSASLVVGAGFAGGLALRGLRARAWRAVLSIALVPALVGSAATAFMFKDAILLLGGIETREWLQTWSLLVAVATWQFVPVAALLFFLQLGSVPPKHIDYLGAHKVSRDGRVRHLYWPHSRNLGLLVAVFGFASVYASSDLATVLLHPSQATGTQLVQHWLTELYQVRQGFSPNDARVALLAVSTWTAPVVLLFAGGLVWTLLRLIDFSVKSLSSSRPQSSRTKRDRISLSGRITALLLVSVVVLPPVLMLMRVGTPDLKAAVGTLLEACVYSIPAALLLTAGSVVTAIALRISFPRQLASFSAFVALLLSVFFFLRALPTVALPFLAYDWLTLVQPGKMLFVRVFWGIGQIVVYFPLMVAFVVLINFAVPTKEIEFFLSNGISVGNIFRVSFLRRLWPGYLLVLCFSVSLSLGDTSISSPLSGYVRSVGVDLIKAAGTGKGANPEEAAALLLGLFVFAALASVAVGLGRYVDDTERV